MPIVRENQALNHMFSELGTVARWVLEDLRDCPNTPDAITAWAERYHLQSEPVIARATKVRNRWEESPRQRQRLSAIQVLDVGHGSYGGLRASSEEEKWLGRYMDWFCAKPEDIVWKMLPNPRHETQEAWLERATELYREREQIQFKGGRRPSARRKPKNIDRQCRWFIDMQVNGVSPKQLARRECGRAGTYDDIENRRTQIHSEAKEIATALGVTLRRFR
jgi:hypothetical protein